MPVFQARLLPAQFVESRRLDQRLTFGCLDFGGLIVLAPLFDLPVLIDSAEVEALIGRDSTLGYGKPQHHRASDGDQVMQCGKLVRALCENGRPQGLQAVLGLADMHNSRVTRSGAP